jgi:hypothetical protein
MMTEEQIKKHNEKHARDEKLFILIIVGMWVAAYFFSK